MNFKAINSHVTADYKVIILRRQEAQAEIVFQIPKAQSILHGRGLIQQSQLDQLTCKIAQQQIHVHITLC